MKRKYIDSHWLVFIFQGIVTLFFGCLMLFTASKDSYGMVPLVAMSMLSLSVVEFANSLHRTHVKNGWLVSTLVAIFDAAVGIAFLLISEQNMPWHLIGLAGYTLLRGIFELIIGFRTTVDPTDQFIWKLCGLCGIVFGIAILNSGHLQNIDFVRFFGAYYLIFSVASLIYGVHNRTQQREYREEMKQIKSVRPSKSAKKSHK